MEMPGKNRGYYNNILGLEEKSIYDLQALYYILQYIQYWIHRPPVEFLNGIANEFDELVRIRNT